MHKRPRPAVVICREMGLLERRDRNGCFTRWQQQQRDCQRAVNSTTDNDNNNNTNNNNNNNHT